MCIRFLPELTTRTYTYKLFPLEKLMDHKAIHGMTPFWTSSYSSPSFCWNWGPPIADFCAWPFGNFCITLHLCRPKNFIILEMRPCEHKYLIHLPFVTFYFQTVKTGTNSLSLPSTPQTSKYAEKEHKITTEHITIAEHAEHEQGYIREWHFFFNGKTEM